MPSDCHRLKFPALVVDGSSARFFAGILDAEGRWLAKVEACKPALESLFESVNTALETAELEIADLRAYLYSAGPGSVLGLRLCAMAIETWHRLEEKAPALFAFNSLELVAADLIDRSVVSQESLLVSDWKKEVWNGLRLHPRGWDSVEPFETSIVQNWTGPLYHLPARKGWQSAPANAIEVHYDPACLSRVFSRPGLLSGTNGVCLYESGLNTFKKWTAERHRLPST